MPANLLPICQVSGREWEEFITHQWNPPQTTHRWPTEQGHSPHVTSSIIQFNSINYSFVSNIPWERAKWRLSIIIMTIIYIYIFIYIHIYSYIFIYIIY